MSGNSCFSASTSIRAALEGSSFTPATGSGLKTASPWTTVFGSTLGKSAKKPRPFSLAKRFGGSMPTGWTTCSLRDLAFWMQSPNSPRAGPRRWSFQPIPTSRPRSPRLGAYSAPSPSPRFVITPLAAKCSVHPKPGLSAEPYLFESSANVHPHPQQNQCFGDNNSRRSGDRQVPYEQLEVYT